MTAEELIAEARRNRTGKGPRHDCLEPAWIVEANGIILECLLGDIDYESNPRSGCAMAARMIAAMAAAAEDMAASPSVAVN